MGPGDQTQRERILLGAYECIANWGLSKTTVDDVARQAGISRSTVYRYFPGGREEIVDGVISWQYYSFFVHIYEELKDCTTLEGLLERGLPLARKAILDNKALTSILATDPEVLLPKLTVEVNRTIDRIAEFLSPFVARRYSHGEIDPDEAAGFLARMVLSLLSAPGRWNLFDPEQVSKLVRAELLGNLATSP